MFATVVLIQIVAVSVGTYVNFALEEPCPEKYFGTQKCYTYTYKSIIIEMHRHMLNNS